MKPETRLTTKILKALKSRGGWWMKIHGSAYQQAGAPDIIGCYRGRFVAMEVKTPTKASKLSRAQRITLARLRIAEAHSYVVRSSEAALKALDKIDRELDIS